MRFLPKFHQGHERLVWTIVGLFLALSVISALLFFFGPPFLPMWYSFALGEEQLARREWIATFPALGLAILAVSLWFGRHTHLEHERYIAALSLWSGISLLGLLLLAFLRIVKVAL